MPTKNNIISVSVAAFLLAVFVFDLMSPLGIAAGTPYGLVVLCTLWVKRVYITYVITVLSVLLTILGFYLSAETTGSMNAVIINRILAIIIIVSSAFLVIQRKNADRKIEQLSILSTTDHLTQVKNRLSFDDEIHSEVERSKRYKRPFSLALIDIDNFKKVNDNYGHAQGDYVIKRICNEITVSIRQSDSLYRIGGDEFAIILVETNIDKARIISENIRKQILKTVVVGSDKITVSIGISSFDYNNDKEDEEKLFKRADNALYESKNHGRNRVSVITV